MTEDARQSGEHLAHATLTPWQLRIEDKLDRHLALLHQIELRAAADGTVHKQIEANQRSIKDIQESLRKLETERARLIGMVTVVAAAVSFLLPFLTKALGL